MKKFKSIQNNHQEVVWIHHGCPHLYENNHKTDIEIYLTFNELLTSHRLRAVLSTALTSHLYLQHDDIFVKHLHSALHIVIIINLKHKHVSV